MSILDQIAILAFAAGAAITLGLAIAYAIWFLALKPFLDAKHALREHRRLVKKHTIYRSKDKYQ
ncbi:hypothetical protein [Roseinatronobacter sp.]|uniref:hypothetical protein n=1 Tax=Roseinatronobacter sp. TaxID=1945755 RepID=UPI0025D44F7F|nr:hypothetical protein [Roseibaca sp.]